MTLDPQDRDLLLHLIAARLERIRYDRGDYALMQRSRLLALAERISHDEIVVVG